MSLVCTAIYTHERPTASNAAKTAASSAQRCTTPIVHRLFLADAGFLTSDNGIRFARLSMCLPV